MREKPFGRTLLVLLDRDQWVVCALVKGGKPSGPSFSKSVWSLALVKRATPASKKLAEYYLFLQ